jgi:hypothetical protein
VLALLDDAVQMVAALDEPAERNFVRAHLEPDERPTRIFGSKPGTYGAGLLQLVDSRSWRDDADLAEVYSTWGGYAYGRGLDGVPARGAMEAAYRRIAVAAKNTDTREHDIADSDDYYQYHGGMIATVRALTGSAPAAYVGDSTRPEAVRTRTLHEETSRVFRARVVNPRWMEAMRRHGYKGAFEMAATVDYLFGWDATTGVIADWQYEKLTESYVLDPVNREFLADANPWALHGMAERLLEAVDRGLWEAPEEATLDALRKAYLETEGDLEASEPDGLRHRDRRRESRAPDPAGRRRDEPRRRVLHDRQGRGDGRPRRAACRAAGPPTSPGPHRVVAAPEVPRDRDLADPAAYVDTRVVRRSGNALAAPPRDALRGDDRRGAAPRGDRRLPRVGATRALRRHPSPAPTDRRAYPRPAADRVDPGDQQRRRPRRRARAGPEPGRRTRADHHRPPARGGGHAP